MARREDCDWEPVAYGRPNPTDHPADTITIDKVYQRDGSAKWAVRRGRSCFNKLGEWEWEPMPSHRDDEFMTRCRYDTLAEAMVRASIAGEGNGRADQTTSR